MFSVLFVYSVIRHQVKILKMFKCLSSANTLSIAIQTFRPRLFMVVKALHRVCDLLCACYKSICQHSDCHQECDLWFTAEVLLVKQLYCQN